MWPPYSIKSLYPLEVHRSGSCGNERPFQIHDRVLQTYPLLSYELSLGVVFLSSAYSWHMSVRADNEAAHLAGFVRRYQDLIRRRGKIGSPLPTHRGASISTNYRGTERPNGCLFLWLPPSDLVDTTTVSSCENHEVGKKNGKGFSH